MSRAARHWRRTLCGDICPLVTFRIIHYDVEAGPVCIEAGGVERTVLVPVAIVVAARTFCVPPILGERWSDRRM